MSVAKVQVGLLGSARGLQRDLERIAKRSDTSSSEGLAFVLQGTVRRNPQWPQWATVLRSPFVRAAGVVEVHMLVKK